MIRSEKSASLLTITSSCCRANSQIWVSLGLLTIWVSGTTGRLGENNNRVGRFSSSRKPFMLPAHREMIAHHPRRVFEASLDILARETGILLQHIGNGITGGEKLQHRLHRDACALHHRPTVANIRVDDNALV